MHAIRITYDLTDIVQANLLHGRKSTYRGLAGIVIAAVLAPFYADRTLGVGLLFIGVPIAWAVIHFWYWVSSRWTFGSTSFASEVIWRCDDRSIQQESNIGSATLCSLEKTLASPKVLLFYFGRNLFTVIPRRVCADDAQYARLIALGQRLASGTPPVSSTPSSDTTERIL